MKMNQGLSIFLIAILIMGYGCLQQPPEKTENKTPLTPPAKNGTGNQTDRYDPKINPADFTSEVTNRYFVLTPGKKMVYEAQTQDGIERTEVYVTNETKMVYGVETRVVWDRVWLEGDLIEDTKDWYAQHENGDVWYFGEDTKELEGGKVVTTHGSWEAGVDGARPGIIMKGTPVVGDSYRQEYYAGIVEDSGKIVSLHEQVSVPFGNFTECVKTFDWTPIEPGVTENKYYCQEAGGVALEVDIEDNERVKLISVEFNSEPSPSVMEPAYDPKINPADFMANVNNKYFSLVPGKKMIYEAETQDGTERIEVYVTNETRMVMGVKTVVVWDRVWLDGDLIEETRDWYAQHKDGSVWYFGEDTMELAGGKILNREGSWEGGVAGAKPGIIMQANPVVGQSYRQEYYAGVAEDMADVLALNASVSVPFGSFSNCLQTYDWTPLDPSSKEHKFYCTGPAGVVLEVVLEDGERSELVSVGYNAQPTPSEEPSGELDTTITEEDARQIALEEVPGKVTDLAIETKFGRLCYVVEVDADSGPETDVIIDMESGEVLAVET